MFVDFSDDPIWTQNKMGWNVVPDGLREMLLWISKRYDDPLIYITENGAAFEEVDLAAARDDEQRRGFFEGHLRAGAQAIDAGVRLGGYFAWSLMDNFEWQFGYERRFGMCYVDFDTQERTLKSSGLWYKDTIKQRGQNIAKSTSDSTARSAHRNLALPRQQRELPERVLIGYGSDCDAVRRAVRDGVNVVIWSFMNIVSVDALSTSAEMAQQRTLQSPAPRIVTNLDLSAIRVLIDELDETGYDDVVHLVSFGGWNGPHLDPKLSATEWYSAWRKEVGGLFHGLDWDLEGNDTLENDENLFTAECLDKMGEISRVAKADGYIIGMAPPQSYLDAVDGSSHFSRYVNLTDSQRQWHGDFHYFGANVFAYLLAKYGDYIDVVSVQLYESYSRAAEAVYNEDQQPWEYLLQYVSRLHANDFQYYVAFSEDAQVGLSGCNVTVPLSKLVFGLANGWADTKDEKTVYISPQQVQMAWTVLHEKDLLPRGFMFWTIDEEGTNGVNLARGLNSVLHIRP